MNPDDLDLVHRLRYAADNDHVECGECCFLHMAANEIVRLEFLLHLATAPVES